MYAGQTVCLDCHMDVGQARAKSRHQVLRCETCHGPLATHATGDVSVKPPAINPRLLCLRCHTSQPGLPAGFPNINPADHMGDLPCTDCHTPHSPKIG